MTLRAIRTSWARGTRAGRGAMGRTSGPGSGSAASIRGAGAAAGGASGAASAGAEGAEGAAAGGRATLLEVSISTSGMPWRLSLTMGASSSIRKWPRKNPWCR